MLDQHNYTKKDLEDWKQDHPDETEIIQQIHSSKYKQNSAIIVSMAIAKVPPKDRTTSTEEEPSEKAPDHT